MSEDPKAGGIPMDEWSGATRELHRTIVALANKSDVQTAQMIRLTKWIAWLTVAMFAAVLVQIAILLFPR